MTDHQDRAVAMPDPYDHAVAAPDPDIHTTVHAASPTDLYDRAAAVPRLLRGGRAPRRYADLREAGMSRRSILWAAQRSRLARPMWGIYLPGGQSTDLLDMLRAALLALPPGAVLAHHTAAALYGFGIVPTPAVHVAVPAGSPVPQYAGIRAHESVLPFDGVADVLGLPCLPAARCAVDLTRALPRPDGLAVLDAALRAGACTPDELCAEVALHDRLRGVRKARELIPLSTPLAECRQETHLRLVLHDARLPAPQPQLVVMDEWGVGRHRIDLGYEEAKVGVEYDGASHLDRQRLRRDRSRHNWLAANGWRLRYFTDGDLYWRPAQLVQTVRGALFARRSRT